VGNNLRFLILLKAPPILLLSPNPCMTMFKSTHIPASYFSRVDPFNFQPHGPVSKEQLKLLSISWEARLAVSRNILPTTSRPRLQYPQANDKAPLPGRVLIPHGYLHSWKW
jgi:hypothetical protein